MNKIDIFFACLVVIGLVSMYITEFTSITGNIVNECYDSDSGIKPYTEGNLIGYDETTKKDFCFNTTTLYEYYCLGKKSEGLIQEVYCENGCSYKEGKGKCLEKNEVTGKDLKFGSCYDGCYFKGTCLSVGIRTNDGAYCSISEELEIQLFDGDACNNNFECRSNLCIAGNCVSKAVFDKFLDSLKG